MAEADWSEVDDYISERLLPADPALKAALAESTAAGLPDITVSATQGQLLQLLAQMIGARRILEVGTLGGYSTIWLARALPADGTLVTLELEEHNASVAQANIARAGFEDRVKVLVSAAGDLLPTLEGPFDFVFIDADKASNTFYFDEAVQLSRPGALIVVDNVVRQGGVVDAGSADPNIIGTRALFDHVGARDDVTATAIQTVGAKGWDGFLLARVR